MSEPRMERVVERWYIHDRKQEHRWRKGCRFKHCTFGRLIVERISNYEWDVISDSRDIYGKANVYIVRLNLHPNIMTLTCTCMHGTREIDYDYFDPFNRCRHVDAVRLTLEGPS